MQFDDNNHEVADTLMIHLAIDSSSRNPPDSTITFFLQILIYSFILVLANYPCLVKDTFVSLASGVVEIQPIWENLCSQRVQAIPAFRAFSGADNNGKFARIGKATWFNLFLEATDEIFQAFHELCEDDEISDKTINALESFVCSAYCPSWC